MILGFNDNVEENLEGSTCLKMFKSSSNFQEFKVFSGFD